MPNYYCDVCGEATDPGVRKCAGHRLPKNPESSRDNCVACRLTKDGEFITPLHTCQKD